MVLLCLICFPVEKSTHTPGPQDPRSQNAVWGAWNSIFSLFNEKLSLSILKEKLYSSLAKAFLVFFRREALFFSPKEKLSASLSKETLFNSL